MPCRKENYIFLEQSVRVDSKEVDALVTKIGEALQLHGGSTGGAKKSSVSVSVSCLHGVKPAAPVQVVQVPVQGRAGCCMRLRSVRARRGSPYGAPGSGGGGGGGSGGEQRERGWEQLRAWSKKRADAQEQDDPHRLLQELILSGNLVKEAVRRLQSDDGQRAALRP